MTPEELPVLPVAVSAVRYGSVEMSRSRFFYDYASYGEPDGTIEMDYLFFVVQAGDETTLVDCGFDPAVALRRGRTPLVSVEVALEKLGVSPESVARIIITHFHYDHIGNVSLFPNALLVAQEREIEFWSGPVARRRRFADVAEEPELALLARAHSEGRLIPIDGSGEILPGVVVELVGGHTPGQQIVRVATPSGEIVLASDALHVYEEMEKDRPFGLFSDLAGTYAAFDRLHELADAGASIIAGHDPLVAKRYAGGSGPTAPVIIKLT